MFLRLLGEDFCQILRRTAARDMLFREGARFSDLLGELVSAWTKQRKARPDEKP
jgi:hypothetical protein